MDQVPPPPTPTQLIVFADDWGRHPSSSQHLIRELLPHYPTLWVNTVGTRKPRLTRSDLVRAVDVLSKWFRQSQQNSSDISGWPDGLEVIAPCMYPGYRRNWQRSFNFRQVAYQVFQHLLPNHRYVAITTLPTTADLVGKFPADRWLYYCVDDYSQWPGTDHAVMDVMERELVQGVDAIAVASEVLAKRIIEMPHASEPELLTHGVDAGFWQLEQPPDADVFGDQAFGFMDLNGSPLTFWGLLDERLDKAWLTKLSQACSESTSQSLKLCLVGPVVEELRAWESLTYDRSRGGEVICCKYVDHDKLPAIAYFSEVLIMPYIDAPVTRAMQPLKLLEYLATMKPVIVRDLPSTRAWADCCDLASTAEEFVRLVQVRVKTGTPPEQIEARKRRLASESWTAKAAQLAELINAG